MKLLLTNKRLFFRSTKSLCFLIITNIFYIFTKLALTFINNLNLDIALKIVQAKFMKLKKHIYTTAKKVNTFFKNFYLIKLYITFFKQDLYVIFKLKCNKTDTNDIVILIILAITKNCLCPIITLCFFMTSHL